MFYFYKIKIIKLVIIWILILSGLFLFASNSFRAASLSTLPALGASPDAIAIRALPNPDHYSPLTWYKKNIKLQGSPQALTVDGYEAVRDGRTVYVNAANVVDDNFYTNIYIISYNQEATDATVDIFGQILSHWKFNININQSGNCSKTAEKNCSKSEDCPTNEYCLSEKARVIRDTKRLSDLADMNIALDNYKNKNSKFPTMSAGSYLPNQTLSVWPSWRETLGKLLGIIPPLDPINKLGACSNANFDPGTCWDDKNKKFDGTIPTALPSGSLTYAYSASGDGLSYGLCANMESDYVNIAQGACSEVDPNTNPTVSIPGQTPFFTGSNLPKAYSGKNYQGFIQADRDGLTWSMAVVSGCDLWSNLRLLSTVVPTQRKITADKAGVAGDCLVAITIRSGGLAATQNFTINVTNANLPLIQPVADQTVVVGEDLTFTILANEADSQYPLTYEITGLPDGLTDTVLINGHDNKISGIVIGEFKDYNITVTAIDYYRGQSAPITFIIHVTNQPPTISPIFDQTITIGRPFSFTVQASDPDGAVHYPLTFTIGGNQPNGLGAVTAVNNHDAVISGTLVDQTKEYNNITITATDKYNAVSSPLNFKITITNNPPTFPDQILPPIIGCAGSYTYQMLAIDPDLHNVDKFIITNLPAGLSADDSGKITGIPTVPAGDYVFTVTARDQFYNETISPYSAETAKNFTVPVVNENFAVNLSIANDTIYVYPTGATLPLYYGPVQFNAQASATTPTPVTYSLVNSPAWLTINPNTGSIQGTPTNNTADPGDKTVTVKATTANGCQVVATKIFTIHVLANIWCGDGVVNGAEECEGSGGTGTSATNQWVCNNCRWSGGWCGDGVVNGTEQCDGSSFSVTCSSFGFSAGSLSCNSSCLADTSLCQFVYNEVPALRLYYSRALIGSWPSSRFNMVIFSPTYEDCGVMKDSYTGGISSIPNSSTFITSTDYGASFRAIWSWSACSNDASGVCRGCDSVYNLYIYTYQKQ